MEIERKNLQDLSKHLPDEALLNVASLSLRPPDHHACVAACAVLHHNVDLGVVSVDDSAAARKIFSRESQDLSCGCHSHK